MALNAELSPVICLPWHPSRLRLAACDSRLRPSVAVMNTVEDRATYWTDIMLVSIAESTLPSSAISVAALSVSPGSSGAQAP